MLQFLKNNSQTPSPNFLVSCSLRAFSFFTFSALIGINSPPQFCFPCSVFCTALTEQQFLKDAAEQNPQNILKYKKSAVYIL